MNPKEKARELIEKYEKLDIDDFQSGEFGLFMSLDDCKRLALITVDEVIKQWKYIDVYLADMNGELNPNLKYWYEVKKLINEM